MLDGKGWLLFECSITPHHVVSPPTERPDVAYSLVAVDFLPPLAVNTSLSRLSSQLASGVLQPLPQVAHSLSVVQAALRQMSQARHVGKIVVRAPTTQITRAEPARVIIVTGGLGTLGSLTAAWVAQHSKLQVKVKVKVGKSLHKLHFPVLTSSFRPLFDLPDAPSAVPPTSSEWVPGRPVPKPWRFY